MKRAKKSTVKRNKPNQSEVLRFHLRKVSIRVHLHVSRRIAEFAPMKLLLPVVNNPKDDRIVCLNNRTPTHVRTMIIIIWPTDWPDELLRSITSPMNGQIDATTNNVYHDHRRTKTPTRLIHATLMVNIRGHFTKTRVIVGENILAMNTMPAKIDTDTHA